MKSNLHDNVDHVCIQIYNNLVIYLLIAETKSQLVAVNCLNHLDSVTFTE